MCCGCYGKLGKVSFQCPKCNLARICSEKCAEAKFHCFECEILANSKLEENVQVELQTPLRLEHNPLWSFQKVAFLDFSFGIHTYCNQMNV